jgi:hypothetical protein
VAAVPLIFILLFGVVIEGAARIAFSMLVSTGARKAALLVGLISIALCVLYLPFCAIWGITGAAVASTIIYTAQAIVVFTVVDARTDLMDLLVRVSAHNRSTSGSSTHQDRSVSNESNNDSRSGAIWVLYSDAWVSGSTVFDFSVIKVTQLTRARSLLASHSAGFHAEEYSNFAGR